MAQSHVISGLVRKRARLAGELDQCERCKALRRDLDTLDEALRLLGYDGDPKTIKPVRPMQRAFGRGELRRAVLAILRESNGPVSNVEIAALVIHRKGWDASDAALRRVVAEKVRHVLRRLPAGLVKR